MLIPKEENSAKFVGTLTTELEVDHRIEDIVFYKGDLQVKRRNDTYDTVPLIIADSKLNQLNYRIEKGMKVRIEGQVHTYNEHGDDGKSHLRIYVMVLFIAKATEDVPDQNEVLLCGWLCKQPRFRVTPAIRKEITDSIVACNFYKLNELRKSVYIPCIAWGKLAQLICCMEIGEQIYINGRFQSREYPKRLPDGSIEKRTTYEVSIMELV